MELLDQWFSKFCPYNACTISSFQYFYPGFCNSNKSSVFKIVNDPNQKQTKHNKTKIKGKSPVRRISENYDANRCWEFSLDPPCPVVSLFVLWG